MGGDCLIIPNAQKMTGVLINGGNQFCGNYLVVATGAIANTVCSKY